MFINSVKLKNYRCYANNRIDLISTENQNVVAITGKIEAGKTTLFNAIGWCIFGYETQRLIESKEKPEKNEMGVPNEFSFDPNGKTAVTVELDITLDQGYKDLSRLIIKRTGIYNKSNVHLPISTSVDLIAFDYYNQQVDVNQERILEELMPKEISSFYIFDGEYLQKTAMKSGANVKKGIDKLFKLEKFQNLSQHFTEVLKHYEGEKRKRSKLQGAAREIGNKISTNKEKIYEIEQKVTDLDGEISQLNLDIDQVFADLQDISQKGEDLGRFKELSKKLQNLRDERKERTIELNKFIVQNAYILNSRDIFGEVQKSLNENKLVTDRKLPPEIRVEFLNNLLKEGKCICSRSLEAGTSEYVLVEHLLEEFQKVSTEEYLIDLKYRVGQALNNNNVQQQIESLRTRISTLTNNIETTDKEIRSLNISEDDATSADFTISKFNELRSKNDLYTSELNNKKAEKEKKQREKEGLISENEELAEDLKSYAVDDSETSELDERIKVGELLQGFFKKFSERAIEKFAQVLEENINDVLSKNQILSKFQVRIPYRDGIISFSFTQDGQERYYFSGGQSQLVGIVLMAGFVNVMQNAMKSSVSIPFVVMDHPTSHADQDAKELIHKEIGNLFDGTQIIYLTTNSEFPDLIDRSKSRLGSAYSIINNGSTGSDFRKEE